MGNTCSYVKKLKAFQDMISTETIGIDEEMAMGSPVSPVVANIFMEYLKI